MHDGDDSADGSLGTEPLPSPSPNGSSAPRRNTRRSGRRRTQGVRKVDAWSVLKLSAVFYATMYCVLLVAGALLWTAASATGLRHNVEKFIADLIASGKFHFVAAELFKAATIAGAVMVVVGTATNVLLAVLYNLISDMVGGITFVVEDVPQRAPSLQPVADAQPVPALVPEAELRQSRHSGERGTPPVRPSTSNL